MISIAFALQCKFFFWSSQNHVDTRICWGKFTDKHREKALELLNKHGEDVESLSREVSLLSDDFTELGLVLRWSIRRAVENQTKNR